MSCSSYSCLFVKQWAFGHVHLRLVSFGMNLLFLSSLVTVFMHSAFHPCQPFPHLTVFLSPSLIIPILKLSSSASPTCWQRCFCCIWSGTVHLFLVVPGLQMGTSISHSQESPITTTHCFLLMHMCNSGLADCGAYPGGALLSMHDTKALNLFCSCRFGWKRSRLPAVTCSQLSPFQKSPFATWMSTVSGCSSFCARRGLDSCLCRVSVRNLSISSSFSLMLHSLLASSHSFFTR